MLVIVLSSSSFSFYSLPPRFHSFRLLFLCLAFFFKFIFSIFFIPNYDLPLYFLLLPIRTLSASLVHPLLVTCCPSFVLYISVVARFPQCPQQHTLKMSEEIGGSVLFNDAISCKDHTVSVLDQ